MQSQGAILFWFMFKVSYGRKAFKLTKQFREKGFTFSFFHCFHTALLKWIMPTWDKDYTLVKQTL